MIIGNLGFWNEQQFRDDSRDLDQLSSGDYSPITRAIRRLYANTKMEVRAIPFVERYVAELAGLYGRPLLRSFPGLDETQARQLLDVYRASGVDRSMAKVERALWTQNTVLLVVLPNGVGRVRVVPILPWQVTQIDVADPIDAADPANWSRLVASVPASVNNGQVVMGELEISETVARRQVGGSWRGLYNDEGSNPFGSLPVVAMHRTDPIQGRWCAPVNEAVLNLQISLSLQNSDNDLIVKECAYPQRVLEGATLRQQFEEIALGPDKVLAIMRSGDPDAPAPKLRVVQGQVPVTELVNYAEHKIRLYCSLLGMDPSSFIRTNTAVTASARLFAEQDRARHRSKLEPVLQAGESDLARLIAAVLQLREPLRFPTEFGASCRWAVYAPSADPAQAANARSANYANGVSSPVRDVAREHGISERRARAMVDRNLAASRELGIIPAEPQAEPQAVEGESQGDQPAPTDDSQALNGAQVTAVLTIAQEVAAGSMTETAAIELLMMSFPEFDRDRVARLISEAGKLEPQVEPQAVEVAGNA